MTLLEWAFLMGKLGLQYECLDEDKSVTNEIQISSENFYFDLTVNNPYKTSVD